MKKFALMLVVVCILAASTAVAGQERTKEDIYEGIFGNIENADKESDYEKKLDFYSRALMGVGLYSYNGTLSCGDAEFAKIDPAMAALEKELWEMHNALEKAGNKPKISPAKYEPCGEVLAKKEKKAKADAEASAKAKERGASQPKVREIYTSLRNGSNYEIGRLVVEVDVRSASNQKIGAIKSDGTVTDGRNYKIGSIKSDGEIRNEKNEKIGAVKADGTVTDGRNYKIGSVKADGGVYDNSGKKIGIAPDVRKEWAAAFYFFFFEK